ncbi:MAG: hypothetical protein ACRDAM_10135 [Casimicrobium sp.]
MTINPVQALDRFSDPDDEAQLRELDENLSKLAPADCGESELRALLAVFERFPENDGFGVFWSIVHLLEACGGYAPILVESVLRKPCEFNLLMLNRLINSSVMEVGGQSLIGLLVSTSTNASAPLRAREIAQGFLTYQIEHGRAEI